MSLLGKKVSELTPEEVEFLKEAAYTLRREAEKLEEALEKLRRAEEHLDRLYSDATARKMLTSASEQVDSPGMPRAQELAQAISEYRRAWKTAERARYAYIVHREAIGFRRHVFADRLYPLPPLRKITIGISA